MNRHVCRCNIIPTGLHRKYGEIVYRQTLHFSRIRRRESAQKLSLIKGCQSTLSFSFPHISLLSPTRTEEKRERKEEITREKEEFLSSSIILPYPTIIYTSNKSRLLVFTLSTYGCTIICCASHCFSFMFTVNHYSSKYIENYPRGVVLQRNTTLLFRMKICRSSAYLSKRVSFSETQTCTVFRWVYSGDIL